MRPYKCVAALWPLNLSVTDRKWFTKSIPGIVLYVVTHKHEAFLSFYAFALIHIRRKLARFSHVLLFSGSKISKYVSKS